MSAATPVQREKIIEMLTEARSRTLDLVLDLDCEQMMGPKLRIVNPPLWEIGHVAWFQEKWSLRHLRQRRPLRAGVDELYDSAAIPHDLRWDLPLPDLDSTLDYMQQVLHEVIENLGPELLDPKESYFHLLPLYHEAMHAEALAYTRQTHGHSAPKFRNSTGRSPSAASPADRAEGDVGIPGGAYRIGATQSTPFVFDNEKWSHPVLLDDFSIARAAVTNGQFLEFVEAGGYRRGAWWSDEGWEWRARTGAEHPIYWRREAGGKWLRKVFNELRPLNERDPVIHVSWYEADAFCRWAGRRLPSEAEWEVAASTGPDSQRTESGPPRGGPKSFPWGEEPPQPSRANLDWDALGCLNVDALAEGDSPWGCRQMIGNAWEWTADAFLPYPGFTADPYREYSEPWFGDHKVLRGGCWATRSYLIRNTWRNFYTPDRRDVWAGFRTCAPFS